MQENNNKRIVYKKIFLSMMLLFSLVSFGVLLTKRVAKGEALEMNIQNSFFLFKLFLTYMGFWCGYGMFEKDIRRPLNNVGGNSAIHHGYGTINHSEAKETQEISWGNCIVSFLGCSRCQDQTEDRASLLSNVV